MGRGGWVEAGSRERRQPAPLEGLDAPARAGGSVRTRSTSATSMSISGAGRRGRSLTTTRHADTGIVCFITVAGFLNGPGFERMRDYLRRTTDEIWVIDCSPEGHQPEVNTRIFEGVQQPVCIVLALTPSRGRTQKSRPRSGSAGSQRGTGGQFNALRSPYARLRWLGRVPIGVAGPISASSRQERGRRIPRLTNCSSITAPG